MMHPISRKIVALTPTAAAAMAGPSDAADELALRVAAKDANCDAIREIYSRKPWINVNAPGAKSGNSAGHFAILGVQSRKT